MRLLAVLLICTLPQSAVANCRLALLLALDISSSVNEREDELQRKGLANALETPEVMAAILEGYGHVALSAFEWSGRYQQDPVLGWTALTDEAAVTTVAMALRQSKRSYAEFPTAIGFALEHAAKLFDSAPNCAQQTLDVSGDGVNNDGYSPAEVHQNHRLAGTTVNGLVILGATDNRRDDAALITHYREELLYGPTAFLEAAENYKDFEKAIKRKLIRETSARAVAALQ